MGRERKGSLQLGPQALRALSFFAFFTTLLIYSPNVMALRGGDEGDLTSYFAEPMLGLTFVIAAAIAARAARVAESPRLANPLARVCVLALYALGCILFGLLLWLAPAMGAQLALLSAVLVSLTVVPVCVMWSCCLQDLAFSGAIGFVAVVSMCSVASNMAIKAAPVHVGQIIFIVLVVAGIAWPLASLVMRERGASTSGGASGGASGGLPCAMRDTTDNNPRPVPFGPFLSVMGVPLLGMAISSFAMGVQPGFLFGDAVDAQHLGMLVGSLVLVPLAFVRVRGPLFSFVYQLLLPAFAAVALILCSFPESSLMYECGLGATYAFYAMVSGVAVASAIAAANAGEFPRTLTFGSLIGMFCGMAILGIFLGAKLSQLISINQSVLIVLTCVYGCALMVGGCVRSWRLSSAPETGPSAAREVFAEGLADALATDAKDAQGGAEPLEERLERLAREGGLSPRETEILGYVGRGHSSVYVAKTLLISESTVYTHVRNVYRKLGVTSREELITLLNASNA